MFPAVPYIDWIVGKPAAAAHDLGSSDLRPNPTDGGVVPERLDGRSGLPAGTTLAERLATVYGVDAGNVLVTAGATHANFLAAAAALGRDDADRVLVEEPGYQPLVETPRALGATVERVRRPADDGYGIDPDRIARAVDDRTALVTVTNRHNPTGRVADRETLADAAAAAAEADAPLLVDEVYAPFVGDARDGPFGGPTAADLPNVAVTGSLTKFLGFGGVRVGWLVGPVPLVERAAGAMTHVPAIAEPSVALAGRAVESRAELGADARERLRANHDRLARFVAGRDDLSGTVHDGCSYALLAHESADGDAVAEAAWDADILVVPGRFFDAPGSIRLSLGRSEGADAALRAFGSVLDGL